MALSAMPRKAPMTVSVFPRADAHALDLMFRAARTHNGWTDAPVSEADLRAIHDLAKWGPTTANSQPMRIVFVTTPEAKARLKPALAAGNVDKTMAAPVTAIMAFDMAFYEMLPVTFPHTDARSWFVGKPDAHLHEVAMRSGTLQAGYFILAARALGFDCGPMSGFDAAKVDATFLAGTSWRSNFLINLGHGDPAKLYPRNPRLSFEEVCRVV
jgi:3-hydroxypropanoate dehydrogenase